ncbi:MAG: phosphoribosylglycinamide formyltransferase [Spirochaetaceae bacterium]|nr:phosphoribosylglycinamide formyltransferase [Spirochaetaceae bacterium]MCF7949188.1 phosphoribosylglycinamide formyltransferase [Spirochaetia bacterium]MCF7951200.1 phosphoribosylglycinamide formyltransferase [Spirochaetaceae bacterium]
MLRVAVCISGKGSLVPPLLEAARQTQKASETPETQMEISCVVADRPYAPGLKSNWAEKVPTFLIDRSRNLESISDRLLDLLRPRADMIVLAGFLSILDGSILKAYEGRILNIHPALLPKFGGKGMYGMHVHRAVVAAQEQESGCTVHWVTRGIDSGPIILQRKVSLSPDETPASLQHKVRQIEGPALAAALTKAAASLGEFMEGGCS